ncbi:MAG TPA: DUF2268 domain-containing putative Zn-dependent protease [Pyrinomonadaceae bacterium]|nr:DUF2268 domain-containing putative Zn-dependent protease [Pyrinomonadaceae bacterium]
MARFIYLALALSLTLFVSAAQNNRPPGSGSERKLNRDPEAARIVTSDIDNFWRAYDAARPDYCLGFFQREYFDKGSDGLKAFKRARINQCSFVETLAAHPRYYASIRESTLRVQSMQGQMRESFRKLKALYDGAVFPDVYFLVGCMNSGGTTADAGLLIGAEMYGRTPDTPEEELDGWLKQVLKPVELVPHIVAHELVHYQQKYPAGARTLLAASIKEGAADFVGELISGKNTNQHLHVYGNPRERELWEAFKREMNGTNTSNWLYQGESAKDRPADLGYYVGYKICEAYYRAAKDKRQAVKDILEIKDFNRFLEDSGYESKFGAARGA